MKRRSLQPTESNEARQVLSLKKKKKDRLGTVGAIATTVPEILPESFLPKISLSIPLETTSTARVHPSAAGASHLFAQSRTQLTSPQPPPIELLDHLEILPLSPAKAMNEHHRALSATLLLLLLLLLRPAGVRHLVVAECASILCLRTGGHGRRRRRRRRR